MRSHLARTTTTARTTQATTRMTALAALATASMIALTGCSSSSTPQSSNTTTPSIEITDTTVILDVRTEQEWNEGHLDGAELLDFTGGDFTQALPDLDPDADYVLYCRPGTGPAKLQLSWMTRGLTPSSTQGVSPKPPPQQDWTLLCPESHHTGGPQGTTFPHRVTR